MLKSMGKKIITISVENMCFSKPVLIIVSLMMERDWYFKVTAEYLLKGNEKKIMQSCTLRIQRVSHLNFGLSMLTLPAQQIFSSADNLCKLFGSRSGPREYRS